MKHIGGINLRVHVTSSSAVWEAFLSRWRKLPAEDIRCWWNESWECHLAFLRFFIIDKKWGYSVSWVRWSLPSTGSEVLQQCTYREEEKHLHSRFSWMLLEPPCALDCRLAQFFNRWFIHSGHAQCSFNFVSQQNPLKVRTSWKLSHF